MEFTKPVKFDMLTTEDTHSVMPTKEQIPEEFWNDNNVWNEYFSNLFFSGGAKAKAKEGIDHKLAWRQIGFILASWDTKHELKIAACAYLGSLWLVQVT